MTLLFQAPNGPVQSAWLPCCLCFPGLHLTNAPDCRGRYECARALLRAGADPNYINAGHDLTVFWAIDGGIDMTRLLHECASLCFAS